VLLRGMRWTLNERVEGKRALVVEARDNGGQAGLLSAGSGAGRGWASKQKQLCLCLLCGAGRASSLFLAHILGGRGGRKVEEGAFCVGVGGDCTMR
jgi:hypothetical protein